MSRRKLVRPADSQTVGPADRLAVGVSPLTRPDSFHAGSCGSEREDRTRSRPFDVRVALVFEVPRSFCLYLLFLSLAVSDGPYLPCVGAVRPLQ